jgi:hypothetical protein
MAWATLPGLVGLVGLTRIECRRWDANGDRTGGSCFGGRRFDVVVLRLLDAEVLEDELEGAVRIDTSMEDAVDETRPLTLSLM